MSNLFLLDIVNDFLLASPTFYLNSSSTSLTHIDLGEDLVVRGWPC